MTIKPREKLLNEMRLEMHGPSARDHAILQNEELIIAPQKIYSCGILFPKDQKFATDLEDENVDISSENIDVEEDETFENEFEFSEEETKRYNETDDEKEPNVDDINLATQLKPSTISISFRVEKTDYLNSRIYFGTYQKINTLKSKRYKIKKLSSYYDAFAAFMRKINHADSTVKNYVKALIFISDQVKIENITDKMICQINDINELKQIEEKLFEIEKYLTLDIEKHRVYSSAIKKYLEYLTTEKPDQVIINDIEEDEKTGKSLVYKRKQHRFYFKIDLTNKNNFINEFDATPENYEKKGILKVFCNVRKSDGQDLRTITISLINNNVKTSELPSVEEHFFQSEICVKRPKEGHFHHIGSKLKYRDLDQLIEDMQYSNVKSYSRGHGCSGDWLQNKGKSDKDVTRIFSNNFPYYEVQKTRHRSDPFKPSNKFTRKFQEFSDINVSLEENREKIISNLKVFVEDYKSWFENVKHNSSDIPEEYEKAKQTIFTKKEKAIERLNKGVKFLSENDEALKAFIIANRAMWFQQCHSKLEVRSLEDPFIYPIKEIDNYADKQWHLFQLAFLIMNITCLPTSKNPDPENLDEIELIWFPTGGGKTEAYLGLSAFTIVYNRLIDTSSNFGVEVIMRYTLRLLTNQQFQRASALIFALEYIRKFEDLTLLNAENFNKSKPITIGLWVGLTLTPNFNSKAIEAVKTLQKGKSKDLNNPFQVLCCPWCKTDFENPLLEENPTFDGYQIKKKKYVSFECNEQNCHFSGGELPLYVVDEQIYENPPTMLIGTVDKFAQLSWYEQPGKFFGGNKEFKPPSLIIQDELHLISGPLGSIVGHFEYLIRSICKKNGFLPKIVASTATIKSADKQVKKLYRSEVNIFPPASLSENDNYFSLQDKPGTGRLYVGVFASGTSSVVTAQTHLIAPLLVFRKSLFFNDDKFLERITNEKYSYEKIKYDIDKNYLETVDPFGTLLWYFNSLRELGYAKTLIYTFIQQFIPSLARRNEISGAFTNQNNKVQELTSHANESDLAAINKNLELMWKPSIDFSKQNQNVPVDILLSTNMISVGVDIPRLGLMVITGQPKNTAEYIQASSRVGRGKDGTGLIFTLYNHARSRDRSHFENFKTFHQSFYQHVEPSSITPISSKSRERCLGALIIGILKNVCNLKNIKDFDESYKEMVMDYLSEYFVDYRNEFNNEETNDELIKEVENIFQIIKEYIYKNNNQEVLEWGTMLSEMDEESLLVPYQKFIKDINNQKIPMLTSMRNVDATATARVIS